MDGIQAAFNFVRSRPSGAIINNENDLTLRELQALSTFLQSLSETMSTPATIADFRRFLLNIFDGWNSISQVPPHPLIPDRKFMDTRIKVGLLREDHPLSRNQLNGGGQQLRQRRAGQPVYFGLSLNYETNIVDWAWRDSKNAGILLTPGAWPWSSVGPIRARARPWVTLDASVQNILSIEFRGQDCSRQKIQDAVEDLKALPAPTPVTRQAASAYVTPLIKEILVGPTSTYISTCKCFTFPGIMGSRMIILVGSRKFDRLSLRV